jgi:uncharacterized protein
MASDQSEASTDRSGANLESLLYHVGSRRLQDQFQTRRLADRLQQRSCRTRFNADDKAFIESAIYFFMATADVDGRPDCSIKGGMPGFVRVTGPSELVFPDYDGNGMFKSLGNLLINSNVGLLFVGMHGEPKKLRVNGTAVLSEEDPLLMSMPGGHLVVRVKAQAIFPNCPRYLPRMELMEPSIYAPRADYEPPEPAWKSNPELKDCVQQCQHPRAHVCDSAGTVKQQT